MQDGPLRQSIGNYKGVMLCNRPNDPTDKPQREGPVPFISRVTVKEQLGLNPPMKLVVKPVQQKHSLEILSRHKLWLSQLQKQKELELQKSQESEKLKQKKLKNMKKKYNKPENPPKSEPKLTEKNLKTLESESKPKWAMTQEEAEKVEEQQQEKEVDQLLQFVNELDYDKFISDLEVRQALEIVKERVEEIKKDKEWKQKIAEKYNEENMSQKSKGSSMRDMVEKGKEKVEEGKKEKWDSSSKPDRVSANDDERIAKIVADQVLANYPNLKAVHSNMSVRKMLEKEAKKELDGPMISTIKYEKQQLDPSNLPYLHRNPAV